jgi:DsbC/DsbD-like thiol-disulfide interchange protein/cytochrome c biogenesis protein CcdA
MAAGPVARDGKVEVRLVAESTNVEPGQVLRVGLVVKPDAHWHTYWKNGGDAGFPTSIEWTLPPGFVAGPIQWPIPERIEVGGVVSYGYDGEHVLLVDVRAPDKLPDGPLTLSAKVEWLMCREECIPGKADLVLAPGLDPPAAPELFQRARERLPRHLDEAPVAVSVAREEAGPVFRLEPKEAEGMAVEGAEFFPDTPNQITHDGPQVLLSTRPQPPSQRLALKWASLAKEGEPLSGVLVLKVKGVRTGYELGRPVQIIQGGVTNTLVPPTGAQDPAQPVVAREGAGVEWVPFTAAALAQARADGKRVFVDFTADWCINCKVNERVALNVPSTVKLFRENNVVAMKADWTHRNAEITRVLREHGRLGVPMYLYFAPGAGKAVVLPEAITAGLVADVVAGRWEPGMWTRFLQSKWGKYVAALLAGLLLNVMPCVLPVLALKVFSFVKQGGEKPRRILMHGLVYAAGVVLSFLVVGGVVVAVGAGWGAQFQSPWFLVGMTSLMFVMSLSLLGVFEIGTSLTGAGQGLVKRGGLAGSFFSGVLAVVLSTPCTAPFMGAAVGLAVRESAVVAMTIFALLGVGLALPYVVLSARPAWAKHVPKPGAWMELVKQGMGFLMAAAALWLLWVFSNGRSASAVWNVVALMLCLGVCAWVLGQFATPARTAKTRGLAWMVVSLLVVGGLAWFGRTAVAG